jgi:hypothetical protein
MKRVKRRATAALLIAAALVLGLAVFLAELMKDGSDWAMYPRTSASIPAAS